MAVDRLPIDSFLKGYWGFDEANETDPALDESLTGQNLTVHSSPSTRPGRVNNGRQFDGATTFADAASSVAYRISGDLTLLSWPTLDSVNTGGSLLRCILALDGATGAQADNTQYALFVDQNGAIVYKHEYSTGLVVLMKSANSAFMTQRYGSVSVIRKDAGGGNCNVSLFLNNVLIPWVLVTVNAVSQPVSNPVPSPDGGSTATLKVGKSDKASDGAFWQGVVDELSIHNTARLQMPYLTSAFYRVALNPNLTRLSAFNNVRSIGSAEMGGGSRWWTYERDQNLYVVREQPLGFFTGEIQLTTGGTGANGAPVPGQVTQPELVYDATTDTLVVFWIAGGRGYKLTANSGDAPSTQNMPYTADTLSIIKVRDQTESVRLGAGADKELKLNETTSFASFGSATISFVPRPSFSVAVSPLAGTIYGYAVFRVLGGVEKLLGTVTTQTDPSSNGSAYYFPITRVTGASYFALPLDMNGKVQDRVFRTNVITDVGDQLLVSSFGNAYIGHDGNSGDIGQLGSGPQVQFSRLDPLSPAYISYVNRSPLKIAYNDPDSTTNWIGAGAEVQVSFTDPQDGFFFIGYVNRTPLKLQFSDPDTNFIGAGGSAGGITVGSTGRAGYQA